MKRFLSSLLASFAKSPKRRRALSQKRNTRLGVECLEGRELMSTTPLAPSLTASAVSASQINLTWNRVAGASGYVIDEWVNGAAKQLVSVGSTYGIANVTQLSPGSTYWFEVAAVTASGTTWSAWRSATTYPAAPSLAASAASPVLVSLSWNRVAGATGYVVDEVINGSWQKIGTVSPGNSSVTVSPLNPATTYTFAVGAINASGTSWSPSRSVTTPQVDHPAAQGGYLSVDGTLFGSSGPSFLDVQQGIAGDCWLMASFAAVAARQPGDISSMFTHLGTVVENGSTVDLYAVRLYDPQGVAHEIVVDTELPGGGMLYDHPTAGGVLWAALGEKAYVEANALGYVRTNQIGSDSYSALDSGDPDWALQAITGRSSKDCAISPGGIAADWNAGDPVVLDSNNQPVDGYLVGGHAHALVGYNPSSSHPFEVYNPWGGQDSSGMTTDGNGHVVRGLFNANAAYLSQNFHDQAAVSGAAGQAQQLPYIQKMEVSGSIDQNNWTVPFQISLKAGDSIAAWVSSPHIINPNGPPTPGPIGDLFVYLKYANGNEPVRDQTNTWWDIQATGTYSLTVDGSAWSWAGDVIIPFTLNLSVGGANVPVNPVNPINPVNPVQPVQQGNISGQVWQGPVQVPGKRVETLQIPGSSPVQASTHTGLAGVTVYLDLQGSGAPARQQTITDKNGNYTFGNVAPGSYTVEEVVPARMVAMTSTSAAVTVAAGVNMTGVDFGVAPVLIAPAAPTNVQPKVVSAYEIDLSWANVAGADGYRVYYAEAGQKTIAGEQTLPASATHLSVAPLKPNTTYQFWIQAYNKAGSSNSAQVSAPTKKGILAVVTNGTLEITGTGGADTISVSRAKVGDGYVMSVGGVPIFDGNTGAWFIQPVGRISISGFGANSVIRFDGGSAPIEAAAAIHCGNGATTIYCGDADTTIYAGRGNTLIYGGTGVTWVETGAVAKEGQDGLNVKFADGGQNGREFISDRWAPGGSSVAGNVVGTQSGSGNFLVAFYSVVSRGVDLTNRIHYVGNFNYLVDLYDSNGRPCQVSVSFNGNRNADDPLVTTQGGFEAILFQRAYQRVVQDIDPGQALAALTGSTFVPVRNLTDQFKNIQQALAEHRTVLALSKAGDVAYAVLQVNTNLLGNPSSVLVASPNTSVGEKTMPWADFTQGMQAIWLN